MAWYVRVVFLLAVLAVLVGGGAGALASCSQTPTSVPIRTFERAQRMDVICLRVYGPGSPEPQPQEACAPVPPNVNGSNLDNQLFGAEIQQRWICERGMAIDVDEHRPGLGNAHDASQLARRESRIERTECGAGARNGENDYDVGAAARQQCRDDIPFANSFIDQARGEPIHTLVQIPIGECDRSILQRDRI